MPESLPREPPSASDKVAMWGRHVQARELVRLAVDALGADVRVMPLKGVLLGALGVVDPAERPISDVDLLVFGVGLARATARLSRRGFRLWDVPVARGYLSLAAPRATALSIDVHTILMPVGLGRLRPEYLLRGAQLRDDLFGVSVYVPTLDKLALQCVANVVKDRVVHALPHCARDLAALLARLDGAQRERLTRDLARFSLRRVAALVAAWAEELTAHPAVTQLLEQLAPGGAERARVRARLQQLRSDDRHGIAARIAARGSADSLPLRLAAAAGAGADLMTWPLRRACLHAIGAWCSPRSSTGAR